MGPLNSLIPPGSVCGIDSCLFIYLLADRPPYAEAVQPLLEAIHRGDINGVTSVITLTEVLTKPEQQQQSEMAHAYSLAIHGIDHLHIVEVNETIARKAASLRGFYGFRTPDALQLATAFDGGCSFFITNDRQLQRMQGLKVIILDDILAR